jgi:hypothetical protein
MAASSSKLHSGQLHKAMNLETKCIQILTMVPLKQKLFVFHWKENFIKFASTSLQTKSYGKF